MLERLGIVLYRIGISVSGLCIVIAMALLVAGFIFEGGDWASILVVDAMLLITALISWIIGRIFRFILAGESNSGN